MKDKSIEVRTFYTTDIPAMTLYIEQNYNDIFPESVRDWIETEVNRILENDYVKATVKGCLMRSCLLAQQKTSSMWDNQMLVLKDKNG